MTDSAVVEGHVKLRDGKKWKSRWVVLRKPSPVADCLVLSVSKERGAKEKSSVVLEHICGLETGGGSEGVPLALSILSLNQIIQLGFDNKEALLTWDIRLRYYLGEVHSFKVTVLPGTTLESGPATLHLCNNLLVITRDFPPVITGQWNLLDLRRYGPVATGFVFEGGTRCGYWAGVFFVSCAEGEQISFLFDCIVRGISPSRGPFGIKPLLPESSVTAASVEERLNQEAEELEKRLSLLSQSTASTSSFSSSATGDDHSISGSSENSETSHSDSSISSRVTQWAQPVPPTAAGSSRTTSHSDEKLPLVAETCPKVPPKPTRSRTLQEIGRQNSSDSGIVTGSHSSYSGSFSSDAGRMEEYGTLLSLPPPSNPEKHPCTCPVSHTHEYQVPLSLRYLYDTPRSLLEAREHKEAAANNKTQPIKEQIDVSTAESTIPVSQSSDTHAECLICSPHPASSRTLFTTCPICGGLKRAPLPQKGTALEQSVADVAITGEKPASLNINGSFHQEDKPKTPLCTISTLTASLSQKTSEPQEASPKSYLSSLSDLLGHYSPGKNDTMSIKPSLADSAARCWCLENCNPVQTGSYVSMSSALSKPHCLEFCQPSHALPCHQTSRSSIYENCRKCQKVNDGCMTPGTCPPVIRGALTSPAELKINEGPTHYPLFQELRSEIQHDKAHPAILTSPSVLHLNDGEPTVRDKQKNHMDGGTMDPACKITESQATDRSSESRSELMGSCGQQQSTDETEDSAAMSDRPREVTYVNIPISPVPKKQLHYMELELQEHGSTIRGKGSTKYAQIDRAVTEAAHRVGTQHALGREAGLQRLEQLRRGGAPQ